MVSFADLPYGLQKRLVELAPANSLVDFEETGHLPLKLSRRLRKSAESVNILFTTDTELLQQNKVVRVGDTLNVRIDCPDKYQAMLGLIRGSYTTLEISGKSYPWQLLISLIRPTVRTVNTKPGMILPENELDTFVKELYTIMTNQSLVVHVDGTFWVKLLPKLKLTREVSEVVETDLDGTKNLDSTPISKTFPKILAADGPRGPRNVPSKFENLRFWRAITFF